ncbi:MAG: hypothetical protein ABIS03_13150 [Gemmatimonadaceae bacterium]
MRRLIVAGMIAVMMGCGSSPVEWGSISAGELPPARPARFMPAPSAEACPTSMAITASGRVHFAAWFESSGDSSVILRGSHTGGDAAWTPSVIIDSTDHGSRGCARPPPAIAADSTSGYVHVAWFAEPSAGAGVFFAHSMDGAMTFHAPVAIVYGRNPSRTSVASRGDRVAVAFEDPNAVQPLIAIALSRTMGHIFEERLTATPDNGRARQPIVRLEGDSVRLWWSEYSDDPTISMTRPMYRSGSWK